MVEFHVVTLFPSLVEDAIGHGVLSRGLEQGRLSVRTWDPRGFSTDRHGTVDDRPYGGGPGMVMKVEPLRTAIRAAREAAGEGAEVIYLSPQGQRFDQALATELAKRPSLVLVAGRYEGVDERVLATEVDREVSIGDYVLSGGEMPALVVLDAVARLLPGVLGDAESAEQDSFSDGLLDHPHYTRPELIDEMAVPEVLRSGDHGAVRRWRLKQALGRTWLKRPDLIALRELSDEEQALLDEFREEHGRAGGTDPEDRQDG
jgi:tRNA (guanine37-N1)-methyltransferase